MELKLDRIFKNDTYTIGKLSINGQHFCDTIEDIVRDEKIKHITAIPAGRYEVVITLSNRFKVYLPLLKDVPGFDGIRIHSGNTEKDSSGCIILGENKVKGKVINSRPYVSKLVEKLSTEQRQGIKSYITIN